MSALKPDVDGTHDLGTSALRWRELHVDTITTAAAVNVGTNLVVTGNLTVNGETTTLSTTNLVVEDKTITLASGAGDSNAADGAGISVAGASATLIYEHANTQWEFNKPLEVQGNVLPQANATHDLGSSSLGWNDLYLGENGVLQLGDDQDVTLTHIPDTGVRLNADRKIQFRDATEFLHSDANGSMTLEGETTVKLSVNSNTVLSVDANSVDLAQPLNVDDTTASTSVTTGSLIVDGGMGLAGDAHFGGDLSLQHDAAVLHFGGDDDVSLTHVHDTGLLLNGGMALRFRDAALEVKSSTDGQLDILADSEVAIVAPVVDIDASTAVRISNDLELDSDEAILKFGGDGDVTLTHVEDTGLLLNSGMALQFGEAGENIKGDGNDLILNAGRHVDLNATNTLDIDAAAVDIETTGAFSIDGAAASNITVATDNNDENLTLSVTGATASSLILSSAGTGSDAIDINATAGGIDIDANGALSLDGGTINIGTGSDVAVDVDSSTFDLDASGAITIDGTSTIGIGTAAAAGNISIGTNETQRVIQVGNAIGNTSLDIDAGTGGIAVDTTSGGAISVNATGAQLQLRTTTSGEIDITSAGALDLNGVTLSLDGTDTTNLTMTADEASTKTMTISATNSAAGHVANLDIDADGTVDIDGAGGINIGKAADVAFDIDAAAVDWDCSGAFALDVSGNGISLQGGAASDFTTGSGALTLDGAGGINIAGNAAEVDITTTGTLDVNAGVLDLDMTDASSITLTSAADADDLTIAQAGGTNSSIIVQSSGTGADAIKLSSTAASGGIDIDAGSAGSIAIDAGDNIVLTTGSADGELKLVSAHTAGVALHIDANANAGSIVDIDAGILDIDADAGITIDGTTLSIDSTDTTNLTMTANDASEKVLTIDAANSNGGGTAKISLGATSGTAISIGHTTSETTVNGNATVIGNLTVQGTTTQIDTTHLRVEDRVIQLAKGDAADADVDQGFVFTRSTANLGGGSDKEHGALFFKGSDNSGNGLFVLGVTNDDGSAAWSDGIADDDLSSLKIGKLMLDGTSNHIDVTSSDLTLTAAANIDLIANSGNSDVVITGDVLPAADNTYDLGHEDFAWQDLHLEGDVKMTNAGQVVTGGGVLTLNGAGGVTVTSTGGTLTLDGAGQTVDLNANVLDLDMSDSSNITITSSEAGEDLTIEQVGGNDSSIIIQAAGTGADAVKISTHTNGGSIDINSDDNITVDAADLITLTTADTGADGKISLVSATTGSNVAIHLDGNADTDAIVKIDAGALDLNASGTVDIDGAAGINIGKATDVAFDIDAAAVDWDCSGAFALDVAGAGNGISLQGVAASDFTTSSGALTLSGAGGVTVTSTGGTLSLNGAGQTVDLNAGVLDLDMTDASNISLASAADADDLTIELTGNTNSSIIVQSSGSGADAVKISTHTNGGSIDIDSADNVTIDAAGDVSLTSTAADGLITLHSAHTAGVALLIDANAAAGSILDVDAGILTIDTQGTQTLTSGGTFDIDSAGAVTIDSDAELALRGSAVDVDADNGVLSLDGSNGINIGTNSNVAVDFNAAAFDLDATGLLSLDTTDTSNGVTIGTGTSGVPVSIGHTTSETTINHNLTVVGTSTFEKSTTIGKSGNSANFSVVKSNGDPAFEVDIDGGGNTIIYGNLTVTSALASNGSSLDVVDPLIKLNKNVRTSDDFGWYAPLAGANENVAMVYDVSDSVFKMYTSLNDPTSETFTFTTGSPGTLEIGQIYLKDYEQLAANQSDGTVSTSKHATLVTTGADASIDHVDLGAGSEGQVKVIVMESDGGDNLRVDVASAGWAGGAGTITLADRGHACTLQYINSSWWCIGNNGCTFG